MRVAPEPAGGASAADAGSQGRSKPIPSSGLPAGPGGAKGRVVFTLMRPWNGLTRGEKVILGAEETSPEDVDGMQQVPGYPDYQRRNDFPRRLVARGWGKCCIVGCGDIEIHTDTKTFHTKNGW